MKNIFVISLDEAVRTLNTRKEKFAFINVFKDDFKYRKPEVSFRTSNRRETGCVDVADIPMDDEGLLFKVWDADKIIRLCERCFDLDDIYVVHDDRYNEAVNIAAELAICYDLNFAGADAPKNVHIHTMLKIKHTQVKYSLLHCLSPMEYCKKMLEIMFDQIRYNVCHDRECAVGGLDFLSDRQCTIMLKNGIKLEFYLETFLESLYLPDIEDVEYVQFYYCVPEIAELSSFSDVGSMSFSMYSDNEYEYTIQDHYGNDFGFNSIDGITIGERPIPEKYKDYRTIQRDYWEFYPNNANSSEYIRPEMERTYLGMKKAEEFLAERNGYTPKFCQLPRRFEEFGSFIYEEYAEHFKQYETMMRENNIWNGNEFETACLYAAYFYMGSLLQCGHCENMTILRCFFEHRYKDLKGLSEFEKFWNIDKYVPTTDDDSVNLLCLAAYTLIETVRPYNGHRIPDDAFIKCLERIYELTEGRPELNYAVILTGLFAGAYCQSL